MSKKNKHHEEHIDETWLIPYADLLTLLLALFIVLFASSTIDNDKFKAMKESLNVAFQKGDGLILDMNKPSEPIEMNQNDTIKLEQLKKQLDQYIQDNNLSQELNTGLTENYVLLTIREFALFDSGSAIVKPLGREKVSVIGTILDEYPQYEVIVSGHTDSVPINNYQFESNWDLSSKRAINFMKLLLQNDSLDPKRFSAIGYGEYRPVSDNATEEGRAQNRRVEVKIKRPD
ncbi:flagellar motor protein MotB [Desulforamulus aquiferis]|uniref:OmpA family protein n=1 Tax=Desulforamulus aquiferis TaxID=1397668 RepID=A0AAW7ZJI7_9FIRM|nr:flagellar motor protein MotB [Desulforamulus aquiferis]MDO7789115.1 OmpA family protein [Desulforamulus aquiferis]